MKVVLSSKEFKTFIASISAINKSSIVLTIRQDCLECLSLTEDNSSVCLYSKIFTLEPINLGGNDSVDIQLKDITKLQRLLDVNNSDTFTFEIKGNRLVFSSGRIKDARLILNNMDKKQKKSKTFNPDFFYNHPVTCSCEIEKSDIKSILQASSFADSSEKVYFYTKDEKMVAELNDYEKDNIDSMSIFISDNCEGTMSNKVIILVSYLSKLYLTDNKIKMQISTISHGNKAFDVLFFILEDNNVCCRYFYNTMFS